MTDMDYLLLSLAVTGIVYGFAVLFSIFLRILD